MEEKNINSSLEGGEAVKQPFAKRIENFWYHYKWHTIVSAIIVAVIVICTVQMCSKPTYDVHILYAGDERLSSVRIDGDISEYEKTASALKAVTPDTDGSGEVLLNFLNLFVANEDELLALEERGENIENVSGLISEDSDTLSFNMISGDYYLLFLSERLFLEYDSEYGDSIFVALSDYATASDVKFAGVGARGIYLDSFASFASLEGISQLDPADTVVCLRKINDVTVGVNKAKHKESFSAAEAVLKNIISYK